MEKYLKKENQKDLIRTIEKLKIEKHNTLVNNGCDSYLNKLHIGKNPNDGAVSIFIAGFPVQIQFPHNEGVHLVAQREHLDDVNRFRGYDISKYDYSGCWVDVLPKMQSNSYQLELSLPNAKSTDNKTNSGEYKVNIKSTKKDEHFIRACISLLNWMVCSGYEPNKPKQKK